jgi:cellulose synthase/poly-beta-1,6-N-acetylglucosamine synthase-like glycosyltransferase
MRNAIIGAVLIAAVSTLGDFVWAGLNLRHRVVYGLAHGAILFLCMGAYFGSLQRNTFTGALYGAAIGLAAAGSFYLLAPVAGYSVMFFVWAFVWIALAFLVRNPPVAVRGVLAMLGSGLGFYLISDIWRPFDPQGWDYARHFASWTIAYVPGFLALLATRRR